MTFATSTPFKQSILALVGAVGLVLVAEMSNTAIEAAVEIVNREAATKSANAGRLDTRYAQAAITPPTIG